MTTQKLIKALEFYARREHWMASSSDNPLRRILIAMQGDGEQNGWLVAEQALAAYKCTPPAPDEVGKNVRKAILIWMLDNKKGNISSKEFDDLEARIKAATQRDAGRVEVVTVRQFADLFLDKHFDCAEQGELLSERFPHGIIIKQEDK